MVERKVVEVPGNIDDEKELEELNRMSGQKADKFEIVRYELIKRACRRQERTNLNFKAKSLVWSSMLDRVFGEFCEEVRLDEGSALMRLGWREFIKSL